MDYNRESLKSGLPGRRADPEPLATRIGPKSNIAQHRVSQQHGPIPTERASHNTAPEPRPASRQAIQCDTLCHSIELPGRKFSILGIQTAPFPPQNPLEKVGGSPRTRPPPPECAAGRRDRNIFRKHH